jgi:nucleoside-diphosphate-sugar epimerase
MKRTVLVTGASGFVGHAVCAELLRRGFPVRAALRKLQMPFPDCEQVIVPTLDELTDWSSALRGVDTVIHLAARVHVMHEEAINPIAEFRKVNTAGSLHLARAAADAGVRRLVYVSSIGVNGNATRLDQAYSEKDMPHPHNAYALSKWEAEQALQKISGETGLEVVIVRPPLVYGPNAPGNFAEMMRALKVGVPLPLASVRNLRSLVYLENLVDALLLCATHPAAAGQTYLVSDGEDVSTPDLLRMLGAGLGRSARVFPFPSRLLTAIAVLLGRRGLAERLLGSLRIDSARIRRELDWQPPFTAQQGLQRTAQWYRDHA